MPIPSDRRLLVVAVVRDLMTASRIDGLVVTAGGSMTRFDAPYQLPPPTEVDLMLVDWGDRAPDWGEAIRQWRERVPNPPQIVLFGPHKDLSAHVAARDADLGPMRARSALFAALPERLRLGSGGSLT